MRSKCKAVPVYAMKAYGGEGDGRVKSTHS